uniref:ZP domain-containing protein n=1 Tax=Astyanax mexicanus TaxID=7994 RepID=A0A3B1JUB0_ASTMX
MTRNKFILLMISAMLWSFVFSHETDQTTDYPSEFSPRTVQIGRLFVRIGAEGEGNLQNGLPDDAEGHPSDSQATAGSYKTAETKLQLLNPSVHCGGDSMALRIQGYRLPSFMVDRGGEGVIPVTQLPDNCGISTKRVHRVFLVIVQYEGCDVKQQGDDYVLPLRLWGAPVSMSCPVSSTNVTADQPAGPTEALTPARSIDASTASTVPASDSRPNRYNFGWDNFQPYRHFWPGHTGTPTGAPAPAPSTEASTPASTTAASTAQAVPASDPQQDLYPFGSFPYQYPFYPNRYFWPGHTGAPTGAPAPAPSTAASTGQAVPASDPQTNWNQIPYSQGWNPFYPYRHFWPGHMGVPTATPPPASTTRAPTPASTTRAPTPASTTRAPTPASTTRAPTSASTTGAPTSASTTGAPTSAPTTAASTAQAVPASDPQQDLYPFGSFPYQYPFYPNRYFWPGLTGAPTGAPAPAPSTSSLNRPISPASDPQTNWNQIPYSQGWNPFYHIGIFGLATWVSLQQPHHLPLLQGLQHLPLLQGLQHLPLLQGLQHLPLLQGLQHLPHPQQPQQPKQSLPVTLNRICIHLGLFHTSIHFTQTDIFGLVSQVHLQGPQPLPLPQQPQQANQSLLVTLKLTGIRFLTVRGGIHFTI